MRPRLAALLLLGPLVVLGVVVLRVAVLSLEGPWTERVAPETRPPGDAEQWAAFVARADHAAQYGRLERFLRRRGVGDVVPAWQLCRQGTSYGGALDAFAIPPRELWPNIVPTLRLIRDDVIARIGEVEVVSGYRTREYNEQAGGASESRHMAFEALDVVPAISAGRAALHRELLALWRGPGRAADMGLGLYSGERFHLDTHRHRRW